MARFYYLIVRTVFDRPYFRDASFKHRPEPHSAIVIKTFVGHDCNLAVSQFDAVVSGSDDFPSEYAATVELYSSNGEGVQRRTIRKKIYRVRDSLAAQVERCADDAEQFRRAMAAKAGDERAIGASVSNCPSYPPVQVGTLVWTNAGIGTIEYVRLAAPTYAQPEAVAVRVGGRSRVYPACNVRLLNESARKAS
jgi:hypothetical protein